MDVVTIVRYRNEKGESVVYYQHSCALEEVRELLQQTLVYVEDDIQENGRPAKPLPA